MARYNFSDLTRKRARILRSVAQSPVIVAVPKRPDLILLTANHYYRLAYRADLYDRYVAAGRVAATAAGAEAPGRRSKPNPG